MGENSNAWDKAWTTQEMRDGASNWSLASDAGVNQPLFSYMLDKATSAVGNETYYLFYQ